MKKIKNIISLNMIWKEVQYVFNGKKMDDKKLKSNLIFWGIVLLFLQIVIIIINIKAENSYALIGAGLSIVLIALFMIFSFKKSKLGPIFGIILSILYIISLDFVSIVIGILLLADCIKFLKNLN